MRDLPFDDAWLGRQPFERIKPFLEDLSGLSRTDIAAHPLLNVDLSVVHRCFKPSDPDYFFACRRVPEVNVVLGHDLLTRWISARTAYLRQASGLDLDPVRPAEVASSLKEFAGLTREVAEAAQALSEAVGNDGKFDAREIRKIMAELQDVVRAATGLHSEFAALREQGGRAGGMVDA